MSGAADKTFRNRKNKTGSIKVIEKKGLHRVITVSLGNFVLMLNSDGIGTKVEFAERMEKHDTMAYDLLAMLCDDSVRYGAEPVAVSNILDASSLDKNIISQLAKGMGKAAEEAGVAVVSGEIAELGKRVSGYGRCSYNWGGTVLSIMKKEVAWGGIKNGDAIVGFREKGFRSNGLSLVRKIMEKEFGSRWHREKTGSRMLGSIALTPSTIYSRAALKTLDYAKGIAHITGGGIPGKLGRITGLKKCGADISDPFEPCPLMLLCQKAGNVSDKEAYRVWNMGQGMLIITDRPEKALSAAAEHKINAKIVGEITGGGKIAIKSMGTFNKGEKLVF